MSRRTKLITYIVVIGIVVIGIGIGFAARAGLFAGFADVISTTRKTGTFEVTIRVLEGEYPGFKPFVGTASVYATNDTKYGEHGFAESTCNSNAREKGAAGGDSKGSTRVNQTKTDNSLIFNVDIYEGINNYFVRVESLGHNPKAQSCDFDLFMPATRGGGPHPYFYGQVWMISNPSPNGKYNVVFTYKPGSGGGVVEPEPVVGTGTIYGYVKTKDVVTGELIGVPGVGVAASGKQTNTDAQGFYELKEMEKGKLHTLRYSYAWQCKFKAPLDTEVRLTGDTFPVPTKELERGGVPVGQGALWGIVRDENTSPIEGARITLTKGGLPIQGLDITTDSSGYYDICPLDIGDFQENPYIINVYKQGYELTNQNINRIVEGWDNQYDFVLKTKTPETQVEAFNIRGMVSNSLSKGSISGARVALFDKETDEPIRAVNDDGTPGQPVVATTDKSGIFTLQRISLEIPDTYLKITALGYADGYEFFESRPRQSGSTVDLGNVYSTYNNEIANISGRIGIRAVSDTIIPAGERILITIEREAYGEAKELGSTKTDKEVTISSPTSIPSPEQGSFQIPAEFLGQKIKICAKYVDGAGSIHLGCHKPFGAIDEWFIIYPKQNRTDINIELLIQIKQILAVTREKGTNQNLGGTQVTLELLEGDEVKYQANQTTADSGDKLGEAKFFVPPGFDFNTNRNLIYRLTSSKENYSGDTKELAAGYTGVVGPVSLDLKKEIRDDVVMVEIKANEKLDNWSSLDASQKVAAKKFWAIYASQVQDKDSFKNDISSFMEDLFGSDFSRGITKILSRVFLGPISGILPIDQVFGGLEDVAGKLYEKNAPYPFIKQDYQFAINFNNQEIKYNMQRTTAWSIDHVKPTGVVWDEKMKLKQANNTNSYVVSIPISALPGFSNLTVEARNKAIADFLLAQGISINRNGDNWLTYSQGQILRVQKDVVCSQNEGMWECKVRMVFPYTLSQEALQFFAAGAQLVTDEPLKQDSSQGSIDDSSDKDAQSIIDDNVGIKTINLRTRDQSVTKLLQATLLSGLPQGQYRLSTVAPRNQIYATKPSSSTFEIAANEFKVIPVEFCYQQNAYQDNGTLKVLGEFNGGLYSLLGNAAKKASLVISKAGVSNILYTGNTSKYASFYSSIPLYFCHIQNQDETTVILSGRTIVMSDGLLLDAYYNNTGSASNQTRIVASKLDYEAAQILYTNELTDNQRSAWSKIMATLDTVADSSKDKQFINEAGGIEEYAPENYSDKSQEMYGYSVAAVLNNKTLLKQRMNEVGKQGQNVLKAIIYYAEKTVTGTSEYDAAIDISKVSLPPSRIAKGEWLRENYRNLSVSDKIYLQYAALRSSISGNVAITFINRQINIFNDWVDRVLGRRATGTVTGTVLKAGEPVRDVLVEIGGKIGRSNSQGNFTIRRVTVGANDVEVRDRNTGKVLPLRRPGLTVQVFQSQNTNIILRLLD